MDLEKIKSDIEIKLDASAPQDSLSRFRQVVHTAKNITELRAALDRAYTEENRIIVSDQGTGMSKRDLVDNYLVIGTPSRKRAIDAALVRGTTENVRPPYLGEKGIGRLSAMRLGDRLTVDTAERRDGRLNMLKINWMEFRDLDALLHQITIVPEKGEMKPCRDWRGTQLTIGSLNADWTYNRAKKFGRRDFARLTDPFADAKRRPRIALFWNGNRVPVAHMDRRLIEHAHASAKGQVHLQEQQAKSRMYI